MILFSLRHITTLVGII